jgi:putative transposase
LNKEKNPDAHKYPWLFDKKSKICHRDAKDSAVQEYCDAVHAAKESLKEKQNRIKGKSPLSGKKIKLIPKMKERDPSDNQRVMIPKAGGKPSVTWTYDKDKKKGGFKLWPTFINGEIKVKQKRELKRLTDLVPCKSCDYTAILKYESPGHYYMIVPMKIKIHDRKSEGKIVALDPGVRTFQTGFDNKGDFKEYGKGDMSRIHKIALHTDKIKSSIDKSEARFGDSKEKIKLLKKKRKRLKKKFKRDNKRIEGLKESFHKSLVVDLCKEYDHILISRFQVSGMVKRHERKINSVTVRKMLNWSHFSFRKRLIQHSEKVNVRVHEVSEHYTSKTCGRCGIINWDLKGEKIFKCPKCNFETDRDFNASRNIFLMNVESFIGNAREIELRPTSKETLEQFDSNVQILQF